MPLPLDAAPESVTADAVLLIGDRAMGDPATTFPFQWDLGKEWWDETGLPFVFALWVGRPGCVVPELERALAAARDAGVAAAAEIARQEAATSHISFEDCLRYLRDYLHYYLGVEELRGLDLFRRWSEELGLLPAACASPPSRSRYARPTTVEP